jgi:hypothetical protein
MTWHEAQDNCMGMGMTLATILTDEDQAAVQKTARDAHISQLRKLGMDDDDLAEMNKNDEFPDGPLLLSHSQYLRPPVCAAPSLRRRPEPIFAGRGVLAPEGWIGLTDSDHDAEVDHCVGPRAREPFSHLQNFVRCRRKC